MHVEKYLCENIRNRNYKKLKKLEKICFNLCLKTYGLLHFLNCYIWCNSLQVRERS